MKPYKNLFLKPQKNHDLVPILAAYALTGSFSYVSHQCGHGSLQDSFFSSCVVSKNLVQVTPACVTLTAIHRETGMVHHHLPWLAGSCTCKC